MYLMIRMNLFLAPSLLLPVLFFLVTNILRDLFTRPQIFEIVPNDSPGLLATAQADSQAHPQICRR